MSLSRRASRFLPSIGRKRGREASSFQKSLRRGWRVEDLEA